LTHDLVHLARSLQIDTLDAAWSQAVKSPDPADTPRYCAAIEALCENDMQSRALHLATAMIEAMSAANMLDSAIDLAQRVIRRGAHNEALARNLVAMLEKRFGSEEWFELLRERAGLNPAQITAQAILEFDRLRRYTKGHVVYHQAGWGEGVVDGFIAATRELTVAFASGRREDFPLDTVIGRFKPLDRDDLRAMKLQRMDELCRLAAQDPAALIRIVAKLYRGTINSTQLKSELCPSVITEKDWPGFWKRAKTAATKDPWIKVEGSPTRPTFVVRDKPVGIADEAAQTLAHQNDLGARIGVLRDLLERGQDSEVTRQVLDLADKTVRQAIADKQAGDEKGKKISHAHILDGILFLVEHGREAPVPAAEEVRALLVGPDGNIEPAALDRLATQQSREHAVRLLPEALGPTWVDQCVARLPDFSAAIVESVAQKLVDEGHGARLLDLWGRIAPYPKRHPVMTYLLGRLYADGTFDQRPDKPTPVAVGGVLLHLGRILNAERKGIPLYNRMLGRLTSLLAGKRGFLERALANISREDLGSYLGITERAGEDFPQEISDMVIRAVADKHPDLTAKPERPFWERHENIYTTRDGLRRIKEDYRVMVEEKIPTNSKAIGAAAAQGDLSENSEWESAMEEQRNLTTRATAMDQEIKICRLIEDQDIPEGMVAPGTRVTFTEEGTGVQRSWKVLGPWDVTDDQTINYRAPIARGLLGRRPGDVCELPGPKGPTLVRVDSIERIV
jgi:transcription elongation factor GreA